MQAEIRHDLSRYFRHWKCYGWMVSMPLLYVKTASYQIKTQLPAREGKAHSAVISTDVTSLVEDLLLQQCRRSDIAWDVELIREGRWEHRTASDNGSRTAVIADMYTVTMFQGGEHNMVVYAARRTLEWIG